MKGKDNKPHIGIFGRRNNGKSSLINALAAQDVAIVSATPGTTTDPVKKSVEIFGVGPAILIDTAGIDDTGDLGKLRIKKTLQVLNLIDMAVLVVAGNEAGPFEDELLALFERNDIPFFVLYNKNDLVPASQEFIGLISDKTGNAPVLFSSVTRKGYDQVIEAMRRTIPENAYLRRSILGSLIGKDDVVVLVTPIDNEAPEGRMILPQVQAIRDILDNHAVSVVLRETELEHFLRSSAIIPRMVITDSQAFELINSIVPSHIPLTGFSVMLAWHKGDFEAYLNGTPAIARLKDGDRVLMLESCTHQVACDDIGRFKLPRWISSYTGKSLEFDVVSGLDEIKRPYTDYALVVQCGACMITRRQLINRIRPFVERGIPVTNYGMAIAFLKNIFNRAIQPFVLNP